MQGTCIKKIKKYVGSIIVLGVVKYGMLHCLVLFRILPELQVIVAEGGIFLVTC